MQQETAPVVMNFTFAMKKRKKGSQSEQKQGKEQEKKQEQEKVQRPVPNANRTPKETRADVIPRSKKSGRRQNAEAAAAAPLQDGAQISKVTNKKEKKAGSAGADAQPAKRQKGNAMEADDPGGSKMKRLTLFVGNMPFNVSEADVLQHFAECSVVSCRLLRNKDTGTSKGIAFVDVADSKCFIAALKLHHSMLGGRVINVEPTAGGGGNSSQRKGKIELKKKRLEKIIKKSGSSRDPAAPKSESAPKRFRAKNKDHDRGSK
jgi:nucleolar protein 6